MRHNEGVVVHCSWTYPISQSFTNSLNMSTSTNIFLDPIMEVGLRILWEDKVTRPA